MKFDDWSMGDFCTKSFYLDCCVSVIRGVRSV